MKVSKRKYVKDKQKRRVTIIVNMDNPRDVHVKPSIKEALNFINSQLPEPERKNYHQFHRRGFPQVWGKWYIVVKFIDDEISFIKGVTK